MAKSESHKTFKFQTRDGVEYQIGDGGKHTLLTKEKIEESIREQSALAATSPHLQIEPFMAYVIQARRLAVDWLEGLKQTEMALHGRHSKEERKRLMRLFNHYSKLLAEAMATCGDFEEAIMLLPKHETALKKEYLRLHQAVWKDDGHRCGAKCEQTVMANPTLVTAEHVHRWVFSKKHGKVMPVIACSNPTCTEMNVRPMDGQLLQRHRARIAADKIIRGKSPEDAAQVLTDAKLTAAHVLKV